MLPVDLESFIRTVGYIGVFVIVFAESGLLIGFFLPGDSLLFTAGVLASQGYLDIWVLAPLCFLAAVVGDSVGYAIGQRVGPRLFQREDSRIFKKQRVYQAQAFFEKHGGKAIVLARFIPIVRTFIPMVAGIAEMPYRRFLAYNLIGGAIWGIGVTVAGYALGSQIPPEDVDHYLLPIIAVIILVSVLPGAIHLWREMRTPAGEGAVSE